MGAIHPVIWPIRGGFPQGHGLHRVDSQIIEHLNDLDVNGPRPLLGKLDRLLPDDPPTLIGDQRIQWRPQCLVRPLAEIPLSRLVEEDDVMCQVNGYEPFIGHIQYRWEAGRALWPGRRA